MYIIFTTHLKLFLQYNIFLCITSLSLWAQVQIVQLDEDRGELLHKATFDHPYPTTKVMWIPDPATHYPDLLATSGDYLRLWRVGEGEAQQECMLNNVSLERFYFMRERRREKKSIYFISPELYLVHVELTHKNLINFRQE